jgi:uncharacterized membrane protein YcgQ (UPF0703/DUF1980 family)
MWLFAFQQVFAGSDHSDQSPDSGISVHSAGQYNTAVMIRKLHLQLLQEKERAQKLEQENQEFKRKLAEKERENTEKENFINTLQEVQARKNQTLEKKVLESNRRRDQAVLKSKKDKQ